MSHCLESTYILQSENNMQDDRKLWLSCEDGGEKKHKSHSLILKNMLLRKQKSVKFSVWAWRITYKFSSDCLALILEGYWIYLIQIRISIKLSKMNTVSIHSSSMM